jgi:hypothetical protein
MIIKSPKLSIEYFRLRDFFAIKPIRLAARRAALSLTSTMGCRTFVLWMGDNYLVRRNGDGKQNRGGKYFPPLFMGW